MSILSEELANDPLTRGYAGMTDQQAVDSLNTADRSRAVATVSGAAIFNATDDAEYTALTDAQQASWDRLCAIETVDISSGVAKAREAELFGASTTTRANLTALKTESISRGEELGIGLVTLGMVQAARA